MKKELFKDRIEIGIPYPKKISDEVISRIGIEKFKINVLVNREKTNNVSGGFNPNKTIRLDNGFYVEVNLNINFTNDIISLSNEIIIC